MEDIDIYVEEPSAVDITVDETTAYIIEVPSIAAASVLTTKGDLLGYSTTPERHPIGTDGYILTADSTADRGFKWSAPPESNLIEQGDSSVVVNDAGTGEIAFTIDGAEILNLSNDGQPISINYNVNNLAVDTPMMRLIATGTPTGERGAMLWLDSPRTSSPKDVEVLRINNNDGKIASVWNDGTLEHKGTLLPTADDTVNIGSSSLSYKDAYFIDEDDNRFTTRELFKLHRDYSEKSAFTPYIISHDVTSSVWTVTITASGTSTISFVFDNVVYTTAGASLSVNATSYAGTDASPAVVFFYVTESAGVPVLNASNTNPYGVIANFSYVGAAVVGAVGASSINIYSGVSGPVMMANLADKLFRYVYRKGATYIDGFGITATSSNLTTATGRYEVAFNEITASSLSVNTDGFFHIKSDGTYESKTDFSFTNYSTGEAIGANKYYNVIFGVCGTNVDNATRLCAIVQAGDAGSEYANITAARADENSAIRVVPSNPLIASSFIPIARVIILNDASDYLQAWPNGNYYVDIRTSTGVGGGGGGTASPLTTKGDIYTYDTAEARLPVGANGYVLTADSSEATGLKWTTVSGASMTDPMTTRGDIIYRDSSNVTNRLAVGSASQVLTSDGTDVSWQNASSGFSDPMTTRGDVIYRNSSNVTTRLGAGTNGQVLTSDGTDISWQDATGGFSDPMTTRGDLIYRNSSNTTTRLPAGTANQVIVSDGTDIAWASAPTADKISEGNSSVEVVDTGTGYVAITADASEVGRFNSSGLKLASGADVNEFSTDGTMAGDSDDAVPTEQAVKTYVDSKTSDLIKVWAVRETTDQTITRLVWTTIVFNGEQYDTGSDYNNSTGIFTAPATGWYHFDCILKYYGLDVGAYAYISLYKNTSTRLIDMTVKFQPVAGEVITIGGSCTIYLSASDTIETKTIHNSSGSAVIQKAPSGTNGSFLNIYQIP